MLVVKKTGLVPVTSAKRGGRKGVYGLKPALAAAALRAGEVHLADIPNDIETFEIKLAEAPVEKKQEQETVDTDAIPADWVWNDEAKTFVDAAGVKVHPLKRIKAAQAISGADIVLTDEDKTADIGKADKADAILLAEIKRRAAADNPGT